MIAGEQRVRTLNYHKSLIQTMEMEGSSSLPGPVTTIIVGRSVSQGSREGTAGLNLVCSVKQTIPDRLGPMRTGTLLVLRQSLIRGKLALKGRLWHWF